MGQLNRALQTVDLFAVQPEAQLASNAVFVHSGFRTASTFIWSRFRAAENVIAFCEIFHGILHDLPLSNVRKINSRNWYSKHPEGNPYFEEYKPLIQVNGGIKNYHPSMEIDLFIPEQGPRGPITPAEYQYVSGLIDYAKRLNKSPVLTMVRSLGRVTGMKNAFPGTHILLYRSIFRQWASLSEQDWHGNDWFFRTTKAQLQRSRHDPFINKMVRVFGIDDFSSRNVNSFYLFIALHLYLYSRAVDAADLIIDATKLATDENYRVGIENAIWDEGVKVDFSEARNTFAFSLCPIIATDVIRWLNIIAEWVNRDASAKGRAFVEHATTEIASEVRLYELFAGGIQSILQSTHSKIEVNKLPAGRYFKWAGWPGRYQQ